MIGGNVKAEIQRFESIRNEIGEEEQSWSSTKTLTGFLDLSEGESKLAYNAKIQESTHIFICDYVALGGITAENSRLVIDGETYEVKLIDNPMGLCQQLEIYLKYIGGQEK